MNIGVFGINWAAIHLSKVNMIQQLSRIWSKCRQIPHEDFCCFPGVPLFFVFSKTNKKKAEVYLYLSSISLVVRAVKCRNTAQLTLAEAIFIASIFPEIRIVCHFSLIVLIPPLNHAQWHKTLWWIWCHLGLCYGKGRCKIEEILQHFLRVFHKSVQAGWYWLTCWCLLGQLVQGLNWDTNLSACLVNRCTSIHWKWVLNSFLWLDLV